MSAIPPPLRQDCFSGVFKGRTVFVTGHTGFKGGWLSLWLKAMGARVVGYSLAPSTTPSFFEAARVGEGMETIVGDIRDFSRLHSSLSTARPDFVFHLAAQALVLQSYEEPRQTYETNVMGSVNVFESVRRTPSVKVCVNVTSDKCYENREWIHPYRENDPMGGHDPYSSSKGAVELVASAYRRSFFSGKGSPSLVSVRAGNVIGGGDWTTNRIIPDCVRALSGAAPIEVRHPQAVRPWQHVLEPLSGYLWLAASLWHDPGRYDYGWNFGPLTHENIPVSDVVQEVVRVWGSGDWVKHSDEERQKNPHEAYSLRLDCTKAAVKLGWTPVCRTREAIEKTILWYKEFYTNPCFDAFNYSLGTIASYVQQAQRQGNSWAK